MVKGWSAEASSFSRDLSVICINWKLLSEKSEQAYKLKRDSFFCLCNQMRRKKRREEVNQITACFYE